MNVGVALPKTVFTDSQLERLSRLGEVRFTPDGTEQSDAALASLARDADILVLDPDSFGGFQKAPARVTTMLGAAPRLRGITLTTTSFGWMDLPYCAHRGISVCNIPGYSRESVAEQTIAFLLGAAKRIFVTDRRTQLGAYRLEMGTELNGKTLGIIGIGNIGSRTAELGMGIGMNVVAFNRTHTDVPAGVTAVSLDRLLASSDAVAIHVTHEDANHGMIDASVLSRMKRGVIIVNTTDRSCVDETAMAAALTSGRVSTYVFEGEDLTGSPLAGIETAVMFRGFGWYTAESLRNLWDIVVGNAEAIAAGAPVHVVS